MPRVELVALMLFCMFRSIVRRYGWYALLTKSARRIRHAAAGRAKRSLWGTMAAHSTSGSAGMLLPASQLIARLRAERELGLA